MTATAPVERSGITDVPTMQLMTWARRSTLLAVANLAPWLVAAAVDDSAATALGAFVYLSLLLGLPGWFVTGLLMRVLPRGSWTAVVAANLAAAALIGFGTVEGRPALLWFFIGACRAADVVVRLLLDHRRLRMILRSTSSR